MNIQDIFLYFASFPRIDGVKSMFSNGASDMHEYADLLNKVLNQPNSRLPEINNMVFGQDFDAVKDRIGKLTDNFMMVEVGEIETNKTKEGSIQDSVKVACTIAYKVSANSDLVDQMIMSDKSLTLINQLRKFMLSDNQPWLRYLSFPHAISPFVSSEFNSSGWAFIFHLSGNIFNIK